MPRLFCDALFLRSMVASVFGARSAFDNSGTFDILDSEEALKGGNSVNYTTQEGLRSQL